VQQPNSTVLDWVAEYGVSEADTNPFRYTGEYKDIETNTYYLRARNYDPRIARMLSPDPKWHPGNMIYGDDPDSVFPSKNAITQSSNLYVYGGNNPLKFVDPSGLDAILINKPVDDIGDIIGVEHMSAFFQDAYKNWYFFYWGKSVKYMQVSSAIIFDTMDTINQWIAINAGLNLNYSYRDSVYIKGDFAASHAEAQGWLKTYYTSPSAQNQEYHLSAKNCRQATMELLMMGTLPSGTNVGDYMAKNSRTVSVIPNMNMNNMQDIFYNKANNIAGFESAMQVERAKYEGKPGLIQKWHETRKKNIETIG
jgi:RHS repeat-associated protein